MKYIFKLFIMVMLAGGCANFYCSRYPNNTYSPTVEENMPIYNNYPPTPYEIIGEVGGDGAPASSWGGMGKKMREYAAQIGGDAIVIQDVATPYVGTYTTPTTVNTTSSAHGYANTNIQGSAYSAGNHVYGQANANTYGQVSGHSYTTINPGMSIPMYGKSIKAFVIKFKSSVKTIPTPPSQMVQDSKYGSISNKSFVYTSSDSNLSKRAQVDLSRIFSVYQKTKTYDKILGDKETVYTDERNKIVEEIKRIRDNANKNMRIASLKQWDMETQTALKEEQDSKMKEILQDIEKVIIKFGEENRYKTIYNDKMPGCNEQDISDEIIKILNSNYE